MIRFLAFTGMATLFSVGIASAGSSLETIFNSTTLTLRVIDGDSFWIGSTPVRLHGIDAPRVPRGCEPKGFGPARCELGGRAKDALADLLLMGFRCRADKTDNRNRWLAKCYTDDGLDIAAELVKQGWACAATKYSADYFPHELTAQSGKLGVWGDAGYEPSEMCRAKR